MQTRDFFLTEKGKKIPRAVYLSIFEFRHQSTFNTLLRALHTTNAQVTGQ